MKKNYLKSFCARYLTLLVLALLSTNLAWGENYTLFTGSSIETGDYILVGYQTSSQKYYAMNNTCTSNKYMGITEVSPSNSEITIDNSAIVWTISASQDGYYIINGSKYLDDNATKNDNYVQIVDKATSTSEWTFTSNDNNLWTITNIGNSSEKKTLSFNIGSSRVACYKAIQSGNICVYLYKKETAPVAVEAPTFSVPAGSYMDAQSVTLSCATEGASIYYTTDGTEPTAESTLYESAIAVDKSMTIKAIAIKGEEKSIVATAAYKITTYANLTDLVADGDPGKDGYSVTVTLADEVITDFYTSSSNERHGVYLKVGEKTIEIYCKDIAVPESWIEGGTVSGTLINCNWKNYNGTWELCPTNWSALTYNAPTTYSITIADDITNGTVTADMEEAAAGVEVTLTVTPNEGYKFEEWNVYKTDEQATKVTVTDNKFTMPAYNVTVSATFEAIPTHTVQFYVNGELDVEESVYEGAEIEFPDDPADISSKKFVGWTKDYMDEICDVAPDLVKSATMVGEDLNFYAVFANIEEVPVSWNKVSALADITEGTYVLVSEKTTNTFKYMPNTESSSANPTLGTGITINNNILTNEITDNMPWSLVSTGTANEFYIRPYGNETIGLGTTNSTGANIRISKSYIDTKWTIATSEKANWEIKNDNETPMYLAVYADDAWRNYSSSTTNQNGKFYFFKKEGGTVYSNYCTDVSYTRDVNTENIGTLCVPYAFEKPETMTLYNIVGKDDSKIYFEENEDEIEAGKPYLFRSTEENITLIYTGKKADEAGTYNGLVGTFEGCDITPDDYNYILSNNTLYLVDGDFSCGANRAYIHLDYVSDYNPSDAKADFTLDFNEPTGITSYENDNENENLKAMTVYNLNGMRVNDSYKGIVIMNGKKYINK